MLTSSRDLSNGILCHINLTSIFFGCLTSQDFGNRGLTMHTKVAVYLAVCVPTLFYSCEVGSHTDTLRFLRGLSHPLPVKHPRSWLVEQRPNHRNHFVGLPVIGIQFIPEILLLQTPCGDRSTVLHHFWHERPTLIGTSQLKLCRNQWVAQRISAPGVLVQISVLFESVQMFVCADTVCCYSTVAAGVFR